MLRMGFTCWEGYGGGQAASRHPNKLYNWTKSGHGHHTGLLLFFPFELRTNNIIIVDILPRGHCIRVRNTGSHYLDGQANAGQLTQTRGDQKTHSMGFINSLSEPCPMHARKRKEKIPARKTQYIYWHSTACLGLTVYMVTSLDNMKKMYT